MFYMNIICLVKDLILISTIQNSLKDHQVEFIDNYKGQNFDLLILDMDLPESYELCKKFPEKSFCFGSHKDTELMDKFKQTGCKSVYPRSAIKAALKNL